MGLASKLASAQGGAAPVPNYGGGGGGQQYPPPGQQQQGQPGAPPGQAGGGYPGSKPGYQAYPGQQGPGGAPPYPSSLQPGYPQQQQRPPNTGYQSPAQGGYQSPAPGGYGQQQQYSRPAPPPPGQSPGGYPGQAPPYGGPQQPYGQQSYGQGQPYSLQSPQPPGSYGYGGPPPQQQQQYGAPPPQQQQQYGAPPQQQYGGQPQQGQYGAPPPMSGPGDVAGYQRELEKAIHEKQLQAFYGPGTPGAQRLPQIAQRAAQQVDRLCQAWKIQKEIANDIVRLALYDVIIYIDDSGSMSFEEGGERIKDLQLILQRVAFAATLFDEDGIEVRFMNDEEIPPQTLSGIRSDQQIEQLMRNKRYKGLTPFGTKLREKVLDPLVISKIRARQLTKPVLIIGITDGQPAGENSDALAQSVRYAYQQAGQLGQGAIAFQFAQVGNDQKATEFLAKLDNDPQVGNMVDCTSNYENESAEMARAQPPVDLTPDLWMIKLILGAIDPSYDTKDEKQSMASSGAMPPRPQGGQYGAPPPQQYGGQQQYGQPPGPPPGQYGQQGGYGQGPPQGQSYPPQQGYSGQQQGYGGPQQGQGQYSGGQGGYGAPPGPPRY